MATRPTTATDVDAPTAGPLATLEPDEVLQCRNPEYDLVWYFALENGQPVRYHESFDFEREPVFPGKVSAIVSHPDVSTCRVGRGHLEVARGDGR